MTYTIKLELPDEVSAEDALGFYHELVGALKIDVKTSFDNIDEFFWAEDLTEEHLGKIVRFTNNDARQVIGTLDNVLPTQFESRQILVVDGIAHNVTLGVVRVIS